ncbi:hypothetical protein BAE44_0024569 [Dichanthelium oligosanthes]|uniref:F-box domain-containing protein n=1 Tax=Dichanthelium oligosanthes TaxID=888268 RepID=A0A1E5UNG8_9POAL|nr:hypothetical protein BAE44_0024569 [Dichanthelium oligosanthes]
MEDAQVRRLPERTIADILLRLPAKSLLRSGAACKAWRRITTAPHFLATRAGRHRPALSILVHTCLPAAPRPRGSDLLAGLGSEDVALDALPVSSSEAAGDAGRHRLIRYPITALATRPYCLLLASCDGVLLFNVDDGLYLLCNPITRQWAELPRLPDDYRKELDTEYAFYLHQPSGEFRLLCCSLRRRVWYIVSTGGAAEPRHLKASAADPTLVTRFICSLFMTTTTPVALHGNLHWPPLLLSVTGETRITAFDTVSETFHQMLGPTASGRAEMLKLFEMGRLLAAADFGDEKHVDLWFLEDYSAGRWARRHRVASPWKHGNRRPRNRCGMQSVAAAGDEQGNVILGNSGGLAVYDTRRRKTVRTVDSVMRPESVSRYVFKGSLVQHACFFATPNSTKFPFIHSWG